MKLLVFTAGFYDRDYNEKLSRLTRSCAKFDIDLNVYGKGEFFNFFDSKIRKMGVFLNRYKKEYTHCLFTDAADTFFLSDLKEVIQKYEALGSPPILLSAEKSCYPFADLIARFPDTVGSFRFFNAGGIIAEIQPLLDAISRLKSYYYINNNDNAHWMLAFNERKIDLKIDHNCEIFQTMSDVDYRRDIHGDVMLAPNINENDRMRIWNNQTKTFPSIIHFNGPKGPGSHNDKIMKEVFDATI